MKIPLSQTNNQSVRIPSNGIYNIILTLIIAFSVIWVIYSLTSYSHYSVYLIESKKNN
jgi:hypothetical protein